MQLDAIQYGAMYTGNQRTPVEAGFRTVGHTAYDETLKAHIYWFKDRAEFESHRRALFEMSGHNRPIPVVKMIADKAYLVALPDTLKVSKEAEEKFLVYAKSRFETLRKELADHVADLEQGFAEFTKGKRLAESSLPLPEDATEGVRQGYASVKPIVVTPEPVSEAATLLPPPPPPPPANPDASEMTEEIFAAHGGKSIRLNDFAAKLGLSPETLRMVIEKDARYQPIPSNGWIRLAGDTSPVSE